ncbi:MAG: mechanosensitive ion channel family protein [Crocinitomicaceae bacterium]|nr:mechanosensitive ion channel family protein [Crocinitomicaceae bacterium]
MNLLSVIENAGSTFVSAAKTVTYEDNVSKWFAEKDLGQDWLFKMLGQNTLISVLASVGILISAIVIGKILYWAIGKFVKTFAAKTKTGLDDILVDKLEEPVVYGIVILGFYWAFNRLRFNDSVDSFFANVFMIIFILNVTWLIARVVDSLIEEYIVPAVEKSESDFDDQLLPVLRKTVKVMLWVFGIVVALSNSGFDVGALIAGLGIGGLALALAAQDTVKNIFGGLMIFMDKPFKMKERIKVNGMDGFVEEIGVRSTRLRTLEGRLITIPNGQFSDNAVENVTQEPTRKVVVNLGLTYDTTPDDMEKAMNMLEEIVKSNPKVTDEVLVSFNSWGDFSMGILFIYWIIDEDDILSAQSEVNLAVLKQFNEAGLEFAYPTQTIFKKEME